MNERLITQPGLVFDREHYLRHIEARGATIRRVITELRPLLGLRTALDAGCGVGFFAKILEECGLTVRGFDGREENIQEARRRYPEMPFECGDIEDRSILRLGSFDVVLCFGLLYHLENPLLAIRHLSALTAEVLFLESMCFPSSEPFLRFREEPSLADQSLTDVAFYPSEGCLVKMCYRVGFRFVYRVTPFPDHDDFRETRQHQRRRTVLLASRTVLRASGLEAIPEPRETTDPWEKIPANSRNPVHLARRFWAKSARQKYAFLAGVMHNYIPWLPVPLHLPFGAWWLARGNSIDSQLLSGTFEEAELRCVRRFLRPGMTVLDIGAHHGLYTLLASKCVGSHGRVVAFEPSARERRRLQQHVRLNSCSNVIIEPFALGRERSQAELFLVEGSEDGCNSLRPPAVDAVTRTSRVDVVPLDDYVARTGMGRVDFIKMDVEGGELDVLRGAAQFLGRNPRPVLLAEVYDIRTAPWGYRALEIVRLLDSLDFDWFQLLPDGRISRIEVNWESYSANLVAVPRERTAETVYLTDEPRQDAQD